MFSIQGSTIAWFILGKLVIAAVSAKLLLLVAGLLLLLLFVEFCGFRLFDMLFCVLGTDLLVEFLDARSLSLSDFWVLVGVTILLSCIFDCELIRGCVLSPRGVWLIVK